jgi:hypothetical protein
VRILVRAGHQAVVPLSRVWHLLPRRQPQARTRASRRPTARAPAARLLHHFRTGRGWSVTEVSYGRPCSLGLHALVGKEDQGAPVWRVVG